MAPVLLVDDRPQNLLALAAILEPLGHELVTAGSGEEALVGPYFILRNLRLLRESLLDVETHGRPRIPGGVRTRQSPQGEQAVARIFPIDLYDRVFYAGVTADVWMEPGITAQDLPQTQAVAYHATVRQGRVALVLGAGNVSSIGPLDIFYKLFNEDQVVVCKMNPVNAYLGPLMEVAFRALIDGGYLRDNPARDVSLPRAPGRTHEPWTYLEPAEQDAVVPPICEHHGRLSSEIRRPRCEQPNGGAT